MKSTNSRLWGCLFSLATAPGNCHNKAAAVLFWYFRSYTTLVDVSGPMDLIDLLSLDPEQLTEDEKDETCQSLSHADLGKLTDTQDLKNTVRLLQGLLKFKAEQVLFCVFLEEFLCLQSCAEIMT